MMKTSKSTVNNGSTKRSRHQKAAITSCDMSTVGHLTENATRGERTFLGLIT